MVLDVIFHRESSLWKNPDKISPRALRSLPRPSGILDALADNKKRTAQNQEARMPTPWIVPGGLRDVLGHEWIAANQVATEAMVGRIDLSIISV